MLRIEKFFVLFLFFGLPRDCHSTSEHENEILAAVELSVLRCGNVVTNLTILLNLLLPPPPPSYPMTTTEEFSTFTADSSSTFETTPLSTIHESTVTGSSFISSTSWVELSNASTTLETAPIESETDVTVDDPSSTTSIAFVTETTAMTEEKEKPKTVSPFTTNSDSTTTTDESTEEFTVNQTSSSIASHSITDHDLSTTFTSLSTTETVSDNYVEPTTTSTVSDGISTAGVVTTLKTDDFSLTTQEEEQKDTSSSVLETSTTAQFLTTLSHLTTEDVVTSAHPSQTNMTTTVAGELSTTQAIEISLTTEDVNTTSSSILETSSTLQILTTSSHLTTTEAVSDQTATQLLSTTEVNDISLTTEEVEDEVNETSSSALETSTTISSLYTTEKIITDQNQMNTTITTVNGDFSTTTFNDNSLTTNGIEGVNTTSSSVSESSATNSSLYTTETVSDQTSPRMNTTTSQEDFSTTEINDITLTTEVEGVSETSTPFTSVYTTDLVSGLISTRMTITTEVNDVPLTTEEEEKINTTSTTIMLLNITELVTNQFSTTESSIVDISTLQFSSTLNSINATELAPDPNSVTITTVEGEVSTTEAIYATETTERADQTTSTIVQNSTPQPISVTTQSLLNTSELISVSTEADYFSVITPDMGSSDASTTALTTDKEQETVSVSETSRNNLETTTFSELHLSDTSTGFIDGNASTFTSIHTSSAFESSTEIKHQAEELDSNSDIPETVSSSPSLTESPTITIENDVTVITDTSGPLKSVLANTTASSPIVVNEKSSKHLTSSVTSTMSQSSSISYTKKNMDENSNAVNNLTRNLSSFPVSDDFLDSSRRRRSVETIDGGNRWETSVDATLSKLNLYLREIRRNPINLTLSHLLDNETSELQFLIEFAYENVKTIHLSNGSETYSEAVQILKLINETGSGLRQEFEQIAYAQKQTTAAISLVSILLLCAIVGLVVVFVRPFKYIQRWQWARNRGSIRLSTSRVTRRSSFISDGIELDNASYISHNDRLDPLPMWQTCHSQSSRNPSPFGSSSSGSISTSTIRLSSAQLFSPYANQQIKLSHI